MASALSAQTPDKPKDAGEANVFTTVKDARISGIQNQANSGTCWAYYTKVNHHILDFGLGF